MPKGYMFAVAGAEFRVLVAELAEQGDERRAPWSQVRFKGALGESALGVLAPRFTARGRLSYEVFTVENRRLGVCPSRSSAALLLVLDRVERDRTANDRVERDLAEAGSGT